MCDAQQSNFSKNIANFKQLRITKETSNRILDFFDRKALKSSTYMPNLKTVGHYVCALDNPQSCVHFEKNAAQLIYMIECNDFGSKIASNSKAQ